MCASAAAFFVNSVGGDMMSKIAGAAEAHGAPPGIYLLLFFATFFPASMLAGLAAPAVWAVRREPAARFLLAWLVPCWIVFELVVTKLPHYVLPLYPAIAILIAGAVEVGRAVAPALAGAWRDVVVSGTDYHQRPRCDGRRHDRPRSRTTGLAVLRRRRGVRTVRLAIVRRRRRRAVVFARNASRSADGDRRAMR